MIHAGENPYVCKLCGANFTRDRNLQRHMMVHSGEKPHVCELCGARFTKLSDLKCHATNHTGEKPHKCSMCALSFSRPSHLKRHVLTHTGEKNHVCKQCGKGFRLFHTLLRHEVTHVSKGPYKCTHCGEEFRQAVQLLKHVRSHAVDNVSNKVGPAQSQIFSAHIETNSSTGVHLHFPSSSTTNRSLPEEESVDDIRDGKCVDLQLSLMGTGALAQHSEEVESMFHAVQQECHQTEEQTSDKGDFLVVGDPNKQSELDKTYTHGQCREKTGSALQAWEEVECLQPLIQAGTKNDTFLPTGYCADPDGHDAAGTFTTKKDENDLAGANFGQTGENELVDDLFADTENENYWVNDLIAQTEVKNDWADGLSEWHRVTGNGFDLGKPLREKHHTTWSRRSSWKIPHTAARSYMCGICDKEFSSSSSLKLHTRIHTGKRPKECG